MPKLAFVFFVSILAVAQIILSTFFDLYGVVPNVFLLALVWLSIFHSGRDAWILAVCGGFFLDLYAGTYFGLNLIGLLSLRACLNLMLDTFLPREESFILTAGLLLFSIVAYQLLIFFSQALLSSWGWSDYLEFKRFFGLRIIWQILYSFLIFYPLLFLANKMMPRKV